jgi:hypothetical protein
MESGFIPEAIANQICLGSLDGIGGALVFSQSPNHLDNRSHILGLSLPDLQHRASMESISAV